MNVWAGGIGSSPSALRNARAANVLARTTNVSTRQLVRLGLDHMMALAPNAAAEILAEDEVKRKEEAAKQADAVVAQTVILELPAFPEATGDTVPDTPKELSVEALGIPLSA